MGVRYIDKRCEMCGRLMRQVCSRKRLCKACQKESMRISIHYRQGAKKRRLTEALSFRADTTQCRNCIYRAFLGSGKNIICNYIELTGHMRGCEPSPHCEKYKEGKSISVELRGKWV